VWLVTLRPIFTSAIANIIEYSSRSFGDADEMNDALVDRWNATVGPTDEVIGMSNIALPTRARRCFTVTSTSGGRYARR
jgi:calcineurin-like phosphoesterase family protein